jgi:hypothetical protein
MYLSLSLIILYQTAISQTYDFLKDFVPGRSIIYRYIHSEELGANPDTTIGTDSFDGTLTVNTDSISNNSTDTLNIFHLSIRKVGNEIVHPTLHVSYSRYLDTTYSDSIIEHLNQNENNSVRNHIHGWFIPETILLTSPNPYEHDTTIYYPYTRYYRYIDPGFLTDPLDIRGDTLVLSSAFTDWRDFGSFNTFCITPHDGLVEYTFYLYDWFNSLRIDVSYSKQRVDEVSSSQILPDEFCLYPNYPNPFNGTTRIRYYVGHRCLAYIAIYDILGRAVATFPQGYVQEGTHELNFNSADLSSGYYFCVLRAEKFTFSTKLLLLK